MTDLVWIKLRLPSGASFTKNNVTLSLDDAIDSAVTDYAAKTAAARKYFAIADLLEILLSDTEADSERHGDYVAGKKRTALLQDIERYRNEGADIEAGDTDAGMKSFSNVPLYRTLGDPNDDYLDAADQEYDG